MRELPWFLTYHALWRYALRTDRHISQCETMVCVQCHEARKDAMRKAKGHDQSQEIRMRLRAAEFIGSFTDLRNGRPREIVLLEHSDMKFVVEVQVERNVLLTCLPSGFYVRTEPSIDELRRLVKEAEV